MNNENLIIKILKKDFNFNQYYDKKKYFYLIKNDVMYYIRLYTPFNKNSPNIIFKKFYIKNNKKILFYYEIYKIYTKLNKRRFKERIVTFLITNNKCEIDDKLYKNYFIEIDKDYIYINGYRFKYLHYEYKVLAYRIVKEFYEKVIPIYIKIYNKLKKYKKIIIKQKYKKFTNVFEYLESKKNIYYKDYYKYNDFEMLNSRINDYKNYYNIKLDISKNIEGQIEQKINMIIKKQELKKRL